MAGLNEVSRAAGIRVEYTEQVFSAILAVLTEVGEDGKPLHRNLVIRNFGTFHLRRVAARAVSSPQLPGGRAEVPERTVLRFRPSPSTRDQLNGNVGKAKGIPRKPKKSSQVVLRTRNRKPAVEMEAAVEEMAAGMESADFTEE